MLLEALVHFKHVSYSQAKAHLTRKPDLKGNVITYKVERSERRFLQLYPSDKAGL